MLAPSLVRNVRCSKEARRALASEPSLVTWVSVTAADVERTGEAGLSAVPSQQSVFEEYTEFFGPDGLDPANHELTPASAVALVRSFDLQPTDRFIDLGSARGGVVLAVAATTQCARCAGIELSPSLHAEAQEAKARRVQAVPADAERLDFVQGDLRTAPFADFNVFYCAIGPCNRPQVTHELMTRLSEVPLPPGAPPRRLLLAGFGLHTRGTSYATSAKLTRAYALRGEGIGTQMALPVFQHTVAEGPRVLMEYAVSNGQVPVAGLASRGGDGGVGVGGGGGSGDGSGSGDGGPSSCYAALYERLPPALLACLPPPPGYVERTGAATKLQAVRRDGGGEGGRNDKSAPRWSHPTAQGVNLTAVLKQGGAQRLGTLQQHADELREASISLEATPTCEAMRVAALQLALAEVAAMRYADTEAATAGREEAPAPIAHIDWGAASGVFARKLVAAAGAAAAAAAQPTARPVHSRSFDILPLAEDVEFADMASPPADSWGVADGSVDLMSGIANLTNSRDLPGFFWCCARLLRRGAGVLVLVQPLNFAGATLALRGVGEVEGLFETLRLRFHDLPVRDKGNGPSRVVELVLRRTLQPSPTFPGPAVASQALNRFLRPQRPPQEATAAGGAAATGGGRCGSGGGGSGSGGGGEAEARLAERTAHQLSHARQHTLLGTARSVGELAHEVHDALRAVQGARCAAAMRRRLPAAARALSPEAYMAAAAAATVGGGRRENLLYAVFVSVGSVGLARLLAARLGAVGRGEEAGRRAAHLHNGVLAVLAVLADPDVGGGVTEESGASPRPLTLFAHLDCGSSEKPALGGAPAALAVLAAACDGADGADRVDGADSGGGGGGGAAQRIPLHLEVVELWAASEADAVGVPDAVDGGLCARHKARALLLLLQATAGSYMDGDGFGLHEQLDARQGAMGRHL